MAKKKSGKRDTTIKRVCLLKIKKGKDKGKCKKKGYQVGRSRFAHKRLAQKKANINKRKNAGKKRRG